MNIKQSLGLSKLDSFKALEGLLDKFKLSHGIKEKQISGEFRGVSQLSLGWKE